MKKELTKSYSLFSAHGLVIGCFLLFALACAPMDDKYAGQKRGAIQGPLKVSTNLDPGDIRAQICLGSDLSAGAPHFLFTNQEKMGVALKFDAKKQSVAMGFAASVSEKSAPACRQANLAASHRDHKTIFFTKDCKAEVLDKFKSFTIVKETVATKENPVTSIAANVAIFCGNYKKSSQKFEVLAENLILMGANIEVSSGNFNLSASFYANHLFVSGENVIKTVKTGFAAKIKEVIPVDLSFAIGSDVVMLEESAGTLLLGTGAK